MPQPRKIPPGIQNSLSKIQKTKPLTPAFRPFDQPIQPLVQLPVYAHETLSYFPRCYENHPALPPCYIPRSVI
jgi:hypothetical protein